MEPNIYLTYIGKGTCTKPKTNIELQKKACLCCAPSCSRFSTEARPCQIYLYGSWHDPWASTSAKTICGRCRSWIVARVGSGAFRVPKIRSWTGNSCYIRRIGTSVYLCDKCGTLTITINVFVSSWIQIIPECARRVCFRNPLMLWKGRWHSGHVTSCGLCILMCDLRCSRWEYV